MESFKNYFILALTLVSIGALALAWQESRDLAALRATSVSPEERANLQKRVWDSEKRAQALTRQLAAGGRAAPSLAGADTKRGGGSSGLMSNVLARMNDPEAQKLVAEQMRRQIERRYAALFAELNLPPDKLEQLKGLLVDRQQSVLDVLATAEEQGINDPKDFQKLVESAQADIDGQIKVTLGDAGFAQFQGFQQTVAVRGVVSQLQSNLAGSEVPLTAAQSAQLTQVMAQNPGWADSPALGNRGAAVTDATLTQSQAFLSAPQLQALQQIQKQQQEQQRLQQIMLRGATSGSEATGASASPPP